jgi:hypothetical protein
VNWACKSAYIYIYIYIEVPALSYKNLGGRLMPPIMNINMNFFFYKKLFEGLIIVNIVPQKIAQSVEDHTS